MVCADYGSPLAIASLLEGVLEVCLRKNCVLLVQEASVAGCCSSKLLGVQQVEVLLHDWDQIFLVDRVVKRARLVLAFAAENGTLIGVVRVNAGQRCRFSLLVCRHELLLSFCPSVGQQLGLNVVYILVR